MCGFQCRSASKSGPRSSGISPTPEVFGIAMSPLTGRLVTKSDQLPSGVIDMVGSVGFLFLELLSTSACCFSFRASCHPSLGSSLIPGFHFAPSDPCCFPTFFISTLIGLLFPATFLDLWDFPSSFRMVVSTISVPWWLLGSLFDLVLGT